MTFIYSYLHTYSFRLEHTELVTTLFKLFWWKIQLGIPCSSRNITYHVVSLEWLFVVPKRSQQVWSLLSKLYVPVIIFTNMHWFFFRNFPTFPPPFCKPAGFARVEAAGDSKKRHEVVVFLLMKIPRYLFFCIETGAVFFCWYVWSLISWFYFQWPCLYVCWIVVLLQKDIELMCSIFLRRWMIVSGILWRASIFMWIHIMINEAT